MSAGRRHSAQKKSAPADVAASREQVSSAEPLTAEKMPRPNDAVNVQLSEIVRLPDGGRRIAATAGGISWNLFQFSDGDGHRILATDLAKMLAFANPTDINELVERWSNETIETSLGNIPVISPRSNLRTVRRFTKRGADRGCVTVVDHWLTAEEAMFIVSRSSAPRAVVITKLMAAVFAAVMRGETVSRSSLPQEVVELLNDYRSQLVDARNQLDGVRKDLASSRAEYLDLARVVSGSRQSKSATILRRIREAGRLISKVTKRKYSACRFEIEGCVRAKARFPRDAKCSFASAPDRVLDDALLASEQELLRAATYYDSVMQEPLPFKKRGAR